MHPEITEHMVHKLNQIALNFEAYPREEAITRITTHVQRYWDPRMRRQLRTYIAEGHPGLHELAIIAESRLKPLPDQPVDTGGEDG